MIKMEYKKRLNDLTNNTNEKQEGIFSDYIIFREIKKLFGVPRLSFIHFVLIKKGIETILRMNRYIK
jgi:hypothetical protein